MPHPNALVIERLFAALNQHDATAMAACYREGKVIFHDIAFHFEEKPGIHDMWRMISRRRKLHPGDREGHRCYRSDGRSAHRRHVPVRTRFKERQEGMSLS